MEEGRPERNVAAILATDVTGLRERAKLIFAMIAPVVLALNQQAKNFAITVFGINGGVC